MVFDADVVFDANMAFDAKRRQVSKYYWPLLLVPLVSSVTHAGVLATGEYQIRSVHSNLCLDIAGVSTADGANLQQYGCWSGAMNQRFQVSDLGNGAYSFEAKHSGKMLDAQNQSTSNGTNVQQWHWWGGKNQQWEIRSAGGNTFEIRPRHATNLCLDVQAFSKSNGGNIHLWSCLGQLNQKWIFTDMNGDSSGGSTGGGDTGGGTTTSVTVNGAAFSGKSTGGADVDSSWNIWSNGSIQNNFSFSDPATVSVIAKGSYAGGAWPQMVVSVGGTKIGAVAVDSSQWKTFQFPVTGKTGNQALTVAFTNDYYWSGADRNLYVKSATVASGSTGGGNNDSGGSGDTPVAQHGQLHLSGVNLVDKSGAPMQLRGMSSHGLQWFGQYVNDSSIKWLRDDWNANVIRAAMYTADGGYISNPAIKDKVIETIDAAIKLGVYVIVDWHVLADNDPNIYKSNAIDFFKDIASRYGNTPNVIYEIANEPNGYANWNQHIRPYAVDVINAIRSIDPDNVVIVGTGTWSQDIQDAADNRLSDRNVMYTLHFYAGTHGQYLRDRVDYARSKNAAIFVTEWGTSEASGDGGVYDSQTRTWISFLNQRGISWVNWSLCDKTEASAALAPGASATGNWQDYNLSASGRLVRELMRAQ